MNAPPTAQVSTLKQQLSSIPNLDGPPMVIGVYSFADKTGQRKPSDTVSNLSSAVTQGAETWVIMALQEAGNGTWFDVVERVGMDSIIKERQLIRSTRENFKETTTDLPPMVFAGVLLEGGIVGYDSNVATGGSGARYFGIGASEEYRVDTVTVVMRLVSVSTGRVLLSVADVFKFLDMGTKALEMETGYSVNEPVNYAVRTAIEAGVMELIYEGARKELWSFK